MLYTKSKFMRYRIKRIAPGKWSLQLKLRGFWAIFCDSWSEHYNGSHEYCLAQMANMVWLNNHPDKMTKQKGYRALMFINEYLNSYDPYYFDQS